MATKSFTIKHTKKGMQALVRKLAYMTLFYTSVGIHATEGRKRTVTRYTEYKKDKRKRQQSNREKSQQESKNRDKKDQSSSRKRGMNIATLAYYMEQTVHWTQKKKVHFANGVTIWAGAKIESRPARYFISLWKRIDKWSILQNKAIQYILGIFNQRSISRAGAKGFWDNIGRDAKLLQHQSAVTSEPNKPLTVAIKESNTPLLDSGALLGSLKYKVKKGNTTEFNKIKNLQSLYNFDKTMEGR